MRMWAALPPIPPQSRTIDEEGILLTNVKLSVGFREAESRTVGIWRVPCAEYHYNIADLKHNLRRVPVAKPNSPA